MNAVKCTKYGSPDVLQLVEVDKPTPGNNEVLIRIYATVASPPDCAMRMGKPYLIRFFSGFLKPKNILGDVLAGEIEAIGKNVTKFKKGDRVYGSSDAGWGSYAQYICLRENGSLALKPENFDYGDSAAFSEGALTSLPFLRDKANIKKGQSILIIGASGSVGTTAVQLAKYFGAEVTGVCSSSNLELVKSLGADTTIDYTKKDFTGNGQTYDIIFDAVGKSSFSRCKKSLKQNGVYLSTNISLKIMLQMLWTAKIGSRKAIFAATGLRPSDEKSKDLNILKLLAETGKIKPPIDRTYSLEQIAEAHEYVESGHKKGNVVITIK